VANDGPHKRKQQTKFFAGEFPMPASFDGARASAAYGWRCAAKEASAPSPLRLLGSLTSTSPLCSALLSRVPKAVGMRGDPVVEVACERAGEVGDRRT